MKRWIWAALLALAAPPALALEDGRAADPKGLVSWKTLAQVEEMKVSDRIVPKFSAQIIALDSKQVRLQGFMLPLEPGAKQKRFLLSANVPSCPFCLPGGPDSLIEVLCKKPIAFNSEPIVISGKLSVLRDDPTGLWYRLTEAVLAP
ncbi:MAG TPA: DUF3299 domain-containing protein [Burkholderiales bacterium]|nr:DUF3299 domain-containing protein [Burkholderiales bacterium]